MVVTKSTLRGSPPAVARRLSLPLFRPSRKCVPMREVEHREVLAMLSSGAQILDVLPAHDYDRAHIKGALHIPLRRILADAPASLARSGRAVVYCRDSL